MNYRHAFHAGNFADLVKHAGLMAILARLTAGAAPPLAVIDTHAGAGLYDLESAEARRSGEAQAGIARLMADPAAPKVFDALKAAVIKCNPDRHLRHYPGSPRLIASALRACDRLTAFELRPDDFAELQSLAGPVVETVCAEGYAGAAARVRSGGAQLVLIDPPYEQGDEYTRLLACVGAILRADRQAVVLIWAPLKDLESFDGFLRRLEAMEPPASLVAEARLRPLEDPMRMNGCALVVINDPPEVEPALGEACRWVVQAAGEAGGEARIWRL